ncbi:hypothetical protein RQM59_10880 [Flavobacteriaceae bacterium S356]|uniref:YcxB-like protein domain-containing protein n=1 Tax=Asprobacillus argus TaxID=3076534 RepID=A0ABU3LGN0_9FLAO|nr:hypothetical protein [Flavobacteriaceae bacterium S356]
MNTSLLELKLKRLKISFKKEGNKIIIGKAKTDVSQLFFLILTPLILSIFIVSYSLIKGWTLGKAYIFALLLFLFAIFNLKRIGIKKEANNHVKTLVNNTLKLVIGKDVKTFDSHSINRFTFTVKEIHNDMYEGKLFLLDKDDNSHLILGFDDDSEQLVQNDLVWFMDFLKLYLKMK